MQRRNYKPIIYTLIFCILTTIIPLPASAAAAYDMWDLKPNWARPAISYALSNGYMSGMGSNHFDPSGTVTRAQLAQVLYNRAGSPETDLSENVFSDVDTSKWYASAVTWCQQKQIISGITPTEFAPDAPVTREQVCAMVRNFYSGYLGNTPEQSPEDEMAQYNDWNRVSDWAKDAVSWAHETGFMSGTSGTTLSPGGRTTREQLAQFLFNFDRNVLSLDVALDEETPLYNISTVPLSGKGKTKIVAHRGGGGIATENTMEAFTRSGVLSYYALECDVQRTKDGEYVVFHDVDMNRMTGVPGGVGSYTLKYLQGMRLFETRTNKRVGDKNENLTIPTLREYLQVCKKYNKRAVVDINQNLGTWDIYRIIDIVRSEKYLDKTIFVSFVLNQLMIIRQQLPNQTLLLNCASYSRPEQYMLLMDLHSIGCNCDFQILTKGLVQRLHNKGLKVGCWTVNDTATAQRMISYGVDFMTTDILE